MFDQIYGIGIIEGFLMMGGLMKIDDLKLGLMAIFWYRL